MHPRFIAFLCLHLLFSDMYYCVKDMKRDQVHFCMILAIHIRLTRVSTSTSTLGPPLTPADFLV